MKEKSHGMSLAELLVALGLFAVALSLPLVSLSNRSEGDSRSAVQIVTSELKDARERARSTNEPVALGIPSEGGTKAHTQSYVQIAGWQSPRLVRSFSMEPEAPETYCFTGFWSGSDTFQVDLPRADLDSVPFDLVEWGAPSALNLIVFLPSGAVVTDLPVTDDGCHLVVCNGLDYTPATVEGKNSFQLTEVSDPYTITVSATGGISVEQGVPGATLPQGRPGKIPSPPAVFTPPAEGANSNPTVVAELYPLPHATDRPPGASGTLKLDGFATLRVEAEDPDGDRLLCEWTANQGTFSAEGPVEMEWDPKLKKWVCWHEWAPPPGAGRQDQFDLQYRVTDVRGGVTTGTFGVSGTLEMLPEGRLLFSMKADDTNPNYDLFSVNADGTDVLQLTNDPADDEDAEFSPDGSQIVFISDRDGDDAIFIMNSDGTDVRRLIGPSETGLWNYDPAFDPTGSMVVFCASSGDRNLYLINADGSLPSIGMPTASGLVTQLGNSAFGRDTHQLYFDFWHPEGRFLVVSAGVNQVRGPNEDGEYWDEPEDIYVYDLTTDTYTNVTNRPGTSTQGARLLPTSGPDDVVLYSSEETAFGSDRVFQTTLEDTGLFGPVETTAPVGSTSPSPDGQFVYTDSGGEVAIEAINGSSSLALTDTGGKVKEVYGWALIR